MAGHAMPCYVAFMLGAQTGMRRGEILALIWGQIDFGKSFIHVERAMTDNGLPKMGQDPRYTHSS